MEKEELEKRLEWYSKKYGPYIEKRGLGNWQNLFRKPNMSELTILFMILMMGAISWAYQHDTALCRETMENIEGICFDYCSGLSFEEPNYSKMYPVLNVSKASQEFIIAEDIND